MIHAIPPFIGYCFTPIRIKEGIGSTSHLYKLHAISITANMSIAFKFKFHNLCNNFL